MEILVKKTPQELVETIAEQIVQHAAQAIARRGRFSLALAGGSTPRALYEALALPAWRNRFEWAKVLLFFGDERAVPPDDERSNYRMAQETLVQSVPIPQTNVFRIYGEAPDLDVSARDYDLCLRAIDSPLDLVLLGMGDDGHTASLFPHTPALDETTRWCVATGVAPMEPRVPRLTLTYPAINTAHNVFVIVTGSGKAERVAEALGEGVDKHAVPVAGVKPQSGRLVWMLDQAAAARLS